MGELYDYKPRAKGILNVITNRGTATYRNGMLDFTKGEGGNNHVTLCGPGDNHGYIWIDTHCYGDTFAFCGKSEGSCNGLFRQLLMELFPGEWEKSDSLFHFTAKTFVQFMDAVLERIR